MDPFFAVPKFGLELPNHITSILRNSLPEYLNPEFTPQYLSWNTCSWIGQSRPLSFQWIDLSFLEVKFSKGRIMSHVASSCKHATHYSTKIAMQWNTAVYVGSCLHVASLLILPSLKLNIAPENRSSQNKSSLSTTMFRGKLLVLGTVMLLMAEILHHLGCMKP